MFSIMFKSHFGVVGRKLECELSLLTGLFEVLIVTQGACLFTPVVVKTALFSTQVECCFAPVSNTPFYDIEVVTFTLNDCE